TRKKENDNGEIPSDNEKQMIKSQQNRQNEKREHSDADVEGRPRQRISHQIADENGQRQDDRVNHQRTKKHRIIHVTRSYFTAQRGIPTPSSMTRMVSKYLDI